MKLCDAVCLLIVNSVRVCVGVQVGTADRPSRPSVLRRPQHTHDYLAATEHGHDEQLTALSPDETEQTDGPARQQIPLSTAAADTARPTGTAARGLG